MGHVLQWVRWCWGTRVQDLTEVVGRGYLQEIDSGEVLGEDVEIFTEYRFEFRKARRVGGVERAGFGVMGGLRGHDGLREKGMGNLLGDEGRGITPFEVSGVDVEVIWVAADTPPPDG